MRAPVTFKKYKTTAHALIFERLLFFNNHYKFTFNKVRVKNTKTMWGSCSEKANLNFNYKVALLPKELSDYIIVHELCHLKEFNHSQRFWDLVAETIPNYELLRKILNNRDFVYMLNKHDQTLGLSNEG